MSESDRAVPQRVALVTGAAQGIGRSAAIRLAQDGLDIAINDISAKQNELNSVKEDIEKAYTGARCIIVAADISAEVEVAGMIEKTVENLGSLDVLVANAGVFPPLKSILDQTTENWDHVFSINVLGTFLCYKYAAAQMVKQGRGGRIIGASSAVGRAGSARVALYSATKFAIRGLTQSSAADLAKYEITVNAYAPGLIDTPMIHGMGLNMGGNPSEHSVGSDFTLGQPEDVAHVISFLASPKAGHITGQTISVDGGLRFD